jgi:chromosomal replication initiation ATPase DnaA
MAREESMTDLHQAQATGQTAPMRFFGPPHMRAAMNSHHRRQVMLKAQLVRQMVALAFDIPLAELEAPTRRRAPVALARQVAMYLVHVVYGQPLAEVGRAFGRDRTTAAHACRLVEDHRDDPRFDAIIEQLETALRAVPRPPRGQGRA